MITCSLQSATPSTYFISAKVGTQARPTKERKSYSPKCLMGSKLANGFWVPKGLVPTSFRLRGVWWKKPEDIPMTVELAYLQSSACGRWYVSIWCNISCLSSIVESCVEWALNCKLQEGTAHVCFVHDCGPKCLEQCLTQSRRSRIICLNPWQ